MLPTNYLQSVHSTSLAFALLLLSSVLLLKFILARRGYALGIPRRCHQTTKYCFKNKNGQLQPLCFFSLPANKRILFPELKATLWFTRTSTGASHLLKCYTGHITGKYLL